MNYSRILRDYGISGLLAAVAGVSQWSCSNSNSAGQADAGTTSVKGCGNLTASDAVDITTQKLDAALRAGLTSLAPVDSSIVLARLLTFGTNAHITPSVDGVNNLTDVINTIKDEWLTSGNVESAQTNVVTFKLNPVDVCKNQGVVITGLDGGTTYNSTHQDCVNNYTNHPVRFAVTRVNCDSGDNVHIDLLLDADKKKVLTVDLIGTSAAASLDLGQLLSYSNSVQPVSQSSSQTTVFGTPTTGILSAKLDVGGTNRAHFSLSLDPALKVEIRTNYTSADAGVTDTSLVAINVSPKQNLISADADALAGTVQFSLALAQTKLDFPFDAFAQMFNRSAATGVKHSDSVSMQLPAVDGNFAYSAVGDTLTVTGLDLGQSPSTIVRGGNTLVSWDSNASAGWKVDLKANGLANGNVAIAFSTPFDVHIKYALMPVQTLIVNPQPFTLDDDVDFKIAAPSSSVTLLQDSSGYLNLVGGLSGSLLRVDTGTFAATSRTVPAANATVNAGQCLNRNPSATGSHAMLQTLSGGTCM
jgi:hypothetical protein